MKIADKFTGLYGDHDTSGCLGKKQEIAPHQSIDHVVAMFGDRVPQLSFNIDEGEDAVLEELESRAVSPELHMLEISRSSCAVIESESWRACVRFGSVRFDSTRLFDGDSLNNGGCTFDFGMATHVLEHVEHECACLAEVARGAEYCYVEAPLKHTRVPNDRSQRVRRMPTSTSMSH